jgi:hypothetical protein
MLFDVSGMPPPGIPVFTVTLVKVHILPHQIRKEEKKGFARV